MGTTPGGIGPLHIGAKLVERGWLEGPPKRNNEIGAPIAGHITPGDRLQVAIRKLSDIDGLNWLRDCIPGEIPPGTMQPHGVLLGRQPLNEFDTPIGVLGQADAVGDDPVAACHDLEDRSFGSVPTGLIKQEVAQRGGRDHRARLE